MNSDSIIEVKDLVKNFDEFCAVNQISFEVPRGEIFGFLGPNGAGKTTTINILCTLSSPTGGSAIVNGFDVLKQRSKVRQSIGLVFQDLTLDEYLTGEQNLNFHAYAYGVPRAVRQQRVRYLLELVELWERRKQKVRQYSGGMKRRLEIARGLLHRPKVLFLDEPTLGLDPQSRRLVWNHILSLRGQEDLTIFLTTHYMEEAENCDRIAIIDHGSIVALDTPAKLKDRVGGDLVTLTTEDNDAVYAELKERYHLSPEINDGVVTICVQQGEAFIPELVKGLNTRLLSISVRRPTLDDVFVKLTGRGIRDNNASSVEQMRLMMRGSK